MGHGHTFAKLVSNIEDALKKDAPISGEIFFEICENVLARLLKEGVYLRFFQLYPEFFDKLSLQKPGAAPLLEMKLPRLSKISSNALYVCKPQIRPLRVPQSSAYHQADILSPVFSRPTTDRMSGVTPKQTTPTAAAAAPSPPLTAKASPKDPLSDIARPRSWILNKSEIVLCKEIESNQTVQVFRGTWRGQVVAVKVLKCGQSSGSGGNNSKEDLYKEVNFLGELRSPCIPYFYGVARAPAAPSDDLWIVAEYCAGGSLYDYLHRTAPFTERNFIRLAKDAAQCVCTLHSWLPQILHRDIKSKNFLVTQWGQVKISDFGVSSVVVESTDTLKAFCGSYLYCCPELFAGARYTDRSDVYSLAVVIWEIAARTLCGRYTPPYENLGLDPPQIYQKVCKENVRPVIPQGCPEYVVSLLTACWSRSPEKRPDAATVVKLLGDAEASLKDDVNE